MARYLFSLYRRSRASGFSYYVQFWDPKTCSYQTGRSIARLREALVNRPGFAGDLEP